MNGWKLISALMPTTLCPVWKSQHIVMQNKGQILDWGVRFSISIEPLVFVSLLPPLFSLFPSLSISWLWFERMGRIHRLISPPSEIAGRPHGTSSLTSVTHRDTSVMDGGKVQVNGARNDMGKFWGTTALRWLFFRQESLFSSSHFTTCSGNRAKISRPSELPQSSRISRFP